MQAGSIRHTKQNRAVGKRMLRFASAYVQTKKCKGRKLKKKNKKIPRMKQEKYQDNNKKKTQKN
jgi:hypothetical protein